MQNIMVGACGTNSNREITMSLSEGTFYLLGEIMNELK